MARIGLLLIALIMPGIATASAQADELLFRVLLDDKDIGVHSFRVAPQDDGEVVEIDADFDVTFLAISVYSYDHRNREIWRDGCLRRIASATDDNGDEFRVEGEDQGENFVISTLDEKVELEADCVMSFAYWNRDFLSQPRLLNAQNGDYLSVTVEDQGIESLQLGDESRRARGYRVSNSGADIDITVWYDAESGRWLSLESRVGERVLRYLPLSGDAAARARERLGSRSITLAQGGS